VDAIQLYQEYRLKNEISFWTKTKYGDFYLIPEGGTNELAIKVAGNSNQRRFIIFVVQWELAELFQELLCLPHQKF
jgi:hypothetical protein